MPPFFCSFNWAILAFRSSLLLAISAAFASLLNPAKLAEEAKVAALALSSTGAMSPSTNPPQSSVTFGEVTGDCHVEGTAESISDGVERPVLLLVLRKWLLDESGLGWTPGCVDKEGYATGLLNAEARSSADSAQGLSAATAGVGFCKVEVTADILEAVEGDGALSKAAANWDSLALPLWGWKVRLTPIILIRVHIYQVPCVPLGGIQSSVWIIIIPSIGDLNLSILHLVF
jgi:hypothetical protein